MPEATMDVGEGREQDAEASLITPYGQYDNICVIYTRCKGLTVRL